MQRDWGWVPTGTTHTYDLVETQRRADDWIAYRCAEHGDWEAGCTEAEALGKLFIRLWQEEHPAPVTCHLCGAPVEADALAIQTAADGTMLFPGWLCRACFVAGAKRLKAAIRAERAIRAAHPVAGEQTAQVIAPVLQARVSRSCDGGYHEQCGQCDCSCHREQPHPVAGEGE